MGQNLSNGLVFDISKSTFAPQDQLNFKILGLLWLCSLYGIAMIWFAMALLARWDRAKKTGFFSVIASFILATAWPVIMIYLLMNPA